MHRRIQYRDSPRMGFDGAFLPIISTSGPQGENKGSAQRALAALNHTEAKKELISPVNVKQAMRSKKFERKTGGGL